MGETGLGQDEQDKLSSQIAAAASLQVIIGQLVQKLMDEAKERLSSPLGQQLHQQRKVRVEGVFAWAQELHGLRRTRFKGRWKVQIRLWLTAAAINIKKALGELRKIGHLANMAQTDMLKTLSSNLTSFVNAAKKIAAGIHRILFCAQKHFGNSPR